MRKRFEIQYELGVPRVEELNIPTKSRDQLPPVLRALQYVYSTPSLNQRIFDLLESHVVGDKNQTGRPGMTLWEILVLAAIRLARDADYDELHYVSNSDMHVRGLLGVNKFVENSKEYSLQSLKDNISLIDDELLDRINDIVVEAGHQLLKKKTSRSR